MEFQGRVALITGAASGIGRAAALRFAAGGAHLYLGDVNADGLETVAGEIRAMGREVATETFDVADAGACRAAVAAAVGRFGRLDVLCNIAGIVKAENLADISDEAWMRTVGINLNGVFFMCRAAMPHLLETGGNIVNMGSTAGLVGQAYNVPYCATKGGVVMMSKALAIEFAGRGVRVNAVCPGGVKTPLTDKFTLPEGADMKLVERLWPLMEMAEPEEVAEIVAYLASDKARYITGVALPIDGGQVIG